MNIDLVKAAIVSTMMEITNIGYVDDCQGRTVNLPWEGSSILPLWNISVSGGQKLETDEFPSNPTNIFWEHQFDIKGYFPFNFDSKSELTWDDYIQEVINKLSPSPALDVCVFTDPPILDDNDFVMYGAADGAVLCHYAKLTFKCIEYYVPA